jgi:predicted CXXCH cytochrome family protein
LNAVRTIRILVLSLMLFSVAARAADGPVVLYPPDLMLTSEGQIKVFVYAPDKNQPLNATINFKPLSGLEGDNFKKGEASLNPGLNFLEVGDKRVRIYYLPNAKMERFMLQGKKSDDPFVFRTVKLHPALDDGCEGCHTLEDGKLSSKPQKEACYACHTDHSKAEEGKQVFVHTPVAGGECTSCHDPHLSSLPKLQKSEKGCRECHDPFPEDGVVHKPVGYGDCISCHSPHAGPGAKNLIKPGNMLCATCHEDPHRQHRSAESKGKLTQVPPDFPTDNSSGKLEIACTGCHAPHQSPERRLFVKPQGQLCKTCHQL